MLSLGMLLQENPEFRAAIIVLQQDNGKTAMAPGIPGQCEPLEDMSLPLSVFL